MRILSAPHGQLLREHTRQQPGRHRTAREDRPAPTPLRLHEILERARRAGASIGTLCHLIHERDLGARRILGVITAPARATWPRRLAWRRSSTGTKSSTARPTCWSKRSPTPPSTARARNSCSSSGRFAKIGIPWPAVMGPFVGAVETVAGALVLIGLLTRLAAAALIVDMMVALVSTKIPILLGHGFWGFMLGAVSTYGFWSMAHESRADVSMLLGSLFLLRVGAGPWSLDVWLVRRRRARPVDSR